jgi:hypothetical protein
MTKEQLQILQHSLGVDEYGRTPKGFTPYTRNHFCAGLGGPDEIVCRELIGLGFMKQHETTEHMPYFNCSVTLNGTLAMASESQKPPKLTRSQLRYRRFLDSDCDMSFRDWIRYEQDNRFKVTQ